MKRTLTYTISQDKNKMPIDDYLKSMGYSSRLLIALKKMPESILVNGVWEYVTTLLYTGDILTIQLEETTSSPNIEPVALPLTIVYEDEDILVVNKPANMSIHPSQNHYLNTLANAVSYYYNSQNIPYTFRCINRLDRDTTGLTILAKHMISACILSGMVQSHTIRREYTAIVAGTFSKADGCIDAPIGRVADSTIERMVDYEHGESAKTYYHVEQESIVDGIQISLVSLWLATGRTHQIRVHMKYIGHPILGDFLYHEDMRLITRQALHSYRLTFPHPITGKEMEFIAPLPPDMRLL
ncbi:MAG: RluA family pseudouridine synthase [Lachnospiraceae bacterium]